jgi:hypothetical protein
MQVLMVRRILLSSGVLVAVVLALAAPSFGGTGAVASSGGVLLVDGDGGVPMFRVPNAAVGVPETRCITVTNAGTRPVAARLFAHVDGRLGKALLVRVTRGTLPASVTFPSCDGFAPDAAVDAGLGSGVVYDGTLAAFAGRFAKAPSDPGTWQPGVTRAYEFTVTLSFLPHRGGLGTSASFNWKARGS